MKKKCANCGIGYIDSTKRKVGKTCSKKCASALAVAKRKANMGGSYHTEEWARRRSEKYKGKGLPGTNTAEQRERSSTRMAEAWKSGKLNSENHWAKTEEGKKKISDLHSGKTMSPEARRKMSIAASKRVRNNPGSSYTRGRGGYRRDLNHYVRSSWEANYARVLLHEGVQYEYEKKTFQMSDGSTYTPDFYIPERDTYVEVKGWWTKSARLKVEKFRHEFPQLKLEILGPDSYNDLSEVYGKLINWEKT